MNAPGSLYPEKCIASRSSILLDDSDAIVGVLLSMALQVWLLCSVGGSGKDFLMSCIKPGVKRPGDDPSSSIDRAVRGVDGIKLDVSRPRTADCVEVDDLVGVVDVVGGRIKAGIGADRLHELENDLG